MSLIIKTLPIIIFLVLGILTTILIEPIALNPHENQEIALNDDYTKNQFNNYPNVWSDPVPITNQANLDYSLQPKISIDGLGNAIAVWSEHGSEIMLASKPLGKPWSLPVVLKKEPSYEVVSINIAMNKVGDAIVYWTERVDEEEHYVAKASFMPKGGSWSTPSKLAPKSKIDNLKVALDSTGNALAVWESESESKPELGIYSAYLPKNGKWSSPKLISSQDNLSTSPSLGIDSSGNAVVIWIEISDSTSESSVVGTTFSAVTSKKTFAQSWSSPQTLARYFDELVDVANVAVDPSGNAIAAWSIFNGIYVSKKPLGKPWEDPVTLSQVPLLVSKPILAINQNGDAAVAWIQSEGNNWRFDNEIYISQLPFGGKWSTPQSIEGKRWFVPDLQIKFDTAGNVLAVWSELSYSQKVARETYKIYSAQLPKGGAWTPPQQPPTKGEMSLYPSFCFEPSGRAIMVWLSLDEKYDGEIVSSTLP